MGNFFKNINWKTILNEIIETLKSIGRGDILIKMQVHRLFPYILYMFFIAWVSIWLSWVLPCPAALPPSTVKR